VYPDTTLYNSSTGQGYFYFGAMRNDSINKILYFIPHDSISDKIVYNFNVNLGDTIPADWFNIDPQPSYTFYTVDSIDSVLIHGVYHRQIYPSGGASIIEGIGSTYGLFNPLSWCTECGASLECHIVNSQLIYPNNGACQLVNVAKADGSFVNAYPNPSSGIFKINNLTDIYKITVYDMFGKKVIQEDMTQDQSIDLTTYPRTEFMYVLPGKKIPLSNRF
jgi:hypothetical protein